jgi:hypothetical protein
MTTQTLENTHGVRITFASLRNDGRLDHDCHDEYKYFPVAAPTGWTVTASGHIQTRHDHIRDSWLFSDSKHEIAAVEHETGVEILIAVGVNVGSAAIVGFATWAWARWTESRKKKPPSTFVAERIEERLPDGTELRVKRITVRGTLSPKQIEDVLSSL